MNRSRNPLQKEGLLRRMRKQRLKYIAILPSLITIMNGLCGFAAVGLAAKEKFAAASYMVVLAMIADVLDGRIARMSKNTSSFGCQLDSLCDVISFGVAPAFLMLKVLDGRLGALEEPNPIFASFLHRFFWLAAAAYMSCTAIRLARFNVENEEDESSHMSFSGLPSPAAAGVIVSLVLFHQEMLPELVNRNARLFGVFEDTILYALPLAALGLAMLMISRIHYPHILNQYLSGKKPFAYFLRVLLIIALILWIKQAAIVLIFGGFAASGLVRWLYRKIVPAKAARQAVIGVQDMHRPQSSDTTVGGL